MILSASIELRGRSLLRVSVLSAFDATSVEVANHMRWAILALAGDEVRRPEFDQFLLATAASDWAASAFRSARDAIAVVPCSMGSPMTTRPLPERPAPLDLVPDDLADVDPEEPLMVLRADASDVARRPATIRTGMADL